jgi:hypothetical protein
LGVVELPSGLVVAALVWTEMGTWIWMFHRTDEDEDEDAGEGKEDEAGVVRSILTILSWTIRPTEPLVEEVVL